MDTGTQHGGNCCAPSQRADRARGPDPAGTCRRRASSEDDVVASRVLPPNQYRYCHSSPRSNLNDGYQHGNSAQKFSHKTSDSGSNSRIASHYRYDSHSRGDDAARVRATITGGA